MNMLMVKKRGCGMNKKVITGTLLIALMAITTYLTYKSLDNLSQLDLEDQFDVSFNEEE